MRFPVHIDELLRNRQLPLDLEPPWLGNSISAESWRIIDDEDDDDEESTTLEWRATLPQGQLTDAPYSCLLAHLQLTLVAITTLPKLKATIKSIVLQHHPVLIALAEYLAVHRYSETVKIGLNAFDGPAADDYFTKFSRHGKCGTGSWLDRIDAALSSRILKSDARAATDAWARTAPAKDVQIADDIDRKINLSNSAELPEMRRSLGAPVLRRIRRWLVASKSLDTNGCVPMTLVAALIRVEPRRLIDRPHLRYHLRQFETCTDYAFQDLPVYGVRSSPSGRRLSSTERACYGSSARSIQGHWRSVANIVKATKRIPELSTFNKLLGAFFHNGNSPYVEGAPRGRRTRTVPVEIALQFIDATLRFTMVCDELVSCLECLCKKCTSPKNITRSVQEDAFDNFERTFNSLDLSNFPGLSDVKGYASQTPWGWAELPQNKAIRRRAVEDMRQKLSLEDKLALFVTSVLYLTWIFACSRHKEILNLRPEQIFKKNGRAYLSVRLRKRQMNGLHAQLHKPIPNFLYDLLQSLVRINNTMAKVLTPGRRVPARIFCMIGRTKVAPLRSDLKLAMDMTCEYFHVPNGSDPWYMSPHECRRLFAMSFFHWHGKEATLPALSWFMGHESLSRTWLYVQESMTGEEITDVEARLAAKAVIEQDQQEGADRLRAALLKHFGKTSVALIDPDDMTDYLQLLHAGGVFRVEPHQIRTSRGIAYTVFISVRSGDACPD